jgi:hypothetical protein
MPKPEEMFSKFDKDGDGKLSKDEFMALAEFVHEHMPPPPPERAHSADRGPDGPPRGHFEGHFEGRLEGRFIEGNMGPDGPGRRFRGPDGPPGDGPGHDGDGPPRWRRFMERDGHRGPPGDRDDDDRRPPKHDNSDKEKADKDKAVSAI